MTKSGHETIIIRKLNGSKSDKNDKTKFRAAGAVVAPSIPLFTEWFVMFNHLFHTAAH